MGRIRTIKPDFFKHYGLYSAEESTHLPLRVAFAGLWTICDREGRFKWIPAQLKIEILPYDELDFSEVMEALEAAGFIARYQHSGKEYGWVPSFKDHQVINQREAQSSLPSPDLSTPHVHAHADQNEWGKPSRRVPKEVEETVFARDKACVRCGSISDPTIDHIFPFSMGGTHVITNLRRLCRSCNSARPVAGQALLDDLKRDGLTLDDMPRMCMHVQDTEAHMGKGKEGKGKEGKGKNQTSGFALPDWVPFEPWNAFVETRKENKKPMSDAAKRLAVSTLATLRDQGNDPAAVLNQSTMRSWSGLFEVKNGVGNGNGKSGQRESVQDVLRELGAETGADRAGGGDSARSARQAGEPDAHAELGATPVGFQW